MSKYILKFPDRREIEFANTESAIVIDNARTLVDTVRRKTWERLWLHATMLVAGETFARANDTAKLLREFVYDMEFVPIELRPEKFLSMAPDICLFVGDERHMDILATADLARFLARCNYSPMNRMTKQAHTS